MFYVLLIVILALSFAGCSSSENGDGGLDDFEITNLGVSAYYIEEGESVNVSATVENVGDETGSYMIELLVDGVSEEKKEVEVDAGDTETVSFQEKNQESMKSLFLT
ncbi:hypothetical protein C9439_02485 [archaeon SCG-AAA382B04]|nr:hypothetical protein C9439_02485 [archaeon SCG-AAA382B04]